MNNRKKILFKEAINYSLSLAKTVKKYFLKFSQNSKLLTKQLTFNIFYFEISKLNIFQNSCVIVW